MFQHPMSKVSLMQLGVCFDISISPGMGVFVVHVVIICCISVFIVSLIVLIVSSVFTWLVVYSPVRGTLLITHPVTGSVHVFLLPGSGVIGLVLITPPVSALVMLLYTPGRVFFGALWHSVCQEFHTGSLTYVYAVIPV